MATDRMHIEILRDEELTPELIGATKSLLSEAFEGDFSDEDWGHAFGGTRFIGTLDERVIAHGAVVARRIWIDDLEMNVGYVEAIAVSPEHWRKGFGKKLMAEITRYCGENFALSMLSTDEKDFYRPHGWIDFPGKSFVRIGGEERRSADEDAGLMYLSTEGIELSEMSTAVCEERLGDAW